MRSPHHDLEWTQPEGHFCDFEFDAEGGMNPKFSSFLAQSEPLDYFGLFLSEPIISKMVEETNLYATQVVMSGDAQPQSRIHDWVPTDNQEMKNFIAILGWMEFPESFEVALSRRFPNLLAQSNSDAEDDPTPQSETNGSANVPRGEESVEHILEGITWGESSGTLPKFVYSANTGVSDAAIHALHGKPPEDYYMYFVSEEILQLIVDETNKYGYNKLVNTSGGDKPSARMSKWDNITVQTLKVFLGMLMWQGLMKLPHVRDYWSTNRLFSNEVSKEMSRNKFELIMCMLHFGDNDTQEGDLLYKIQHLLEKLIHVFQNTLTPAEDFCVDESNIPWRGRLSFRQYIPNKKHKYGIKLFKLCVQGGYTWNLKVYTGRDETRVGKRDVMVLSTEHNDDMVEIARRGGTIVWPFEARVLT
ncbi:hypothetical protein M8J75_014309 [Diaphorina citri]|nr:hypothetical protein M8J75_014309 [Diaphorina citri]